MLITANQFTIIVGCFFSVVSIFYFIKIFFSLNRKTTYIDSKVKPTSKTINSDLNENVPNIPKVITKHKTKTVGIIKPYSGTLTRSSSLRIKSVSIIK